MSLQQGPCGTELFENFFRRHDHLLAKLCSVLLAAAQARRKPKAKRINRERINRDDGCRSSDDDDTTGRIGLRRTALCVAEPPFPLGDAAPKR
ncbi:hypothetical protein MEX01_15310 [Methylorubrum extorquens]|nr:hypothetical protein MEX01_15310 [Methylorubrum extorquens]